MISTENIVRKSNHYNGCTLTDRLGECGIPGMSIAIIENGDISTFLYGVKNQNRDMVTESTLFQAASLSKPIFAVAVMRLVENGYLNLDVDIRDYLSEQLYTTFDGKEHKVTLKQLLNHRACFNISGCPGYKKKKIPSLKEFVRGVNNKIIETTMAINNVLQFTEKHNVQLHLKKLPDSEYCYSGGVYVLAQIIVEDVMKKSFAEIANDEVFKPLSMRTATFEQPLTNEQSRDFACGFLEDGTQMDGGYNVMTHQSAGGLWTTPSEYGKFGIELTKVYNNQSSFLKKSSFDSMLNIGLGIGVGSCEKGIVISHTGANYGYRSSMSFCINNGTGFVIMQNRFNDICINGVIKLFTDAFEW